MNANEKPLIDGIHDAIRGVGERNSAEIVPGLRHPIGFRNNRVPHLAFSDHLRETGRDAMADHVMRALSEPGGRITSRDVHPDSGANMTPGWRSFLEHGEIADPQDPDDLGVPSHIDLHHLDTSVTPHRLLTYSVRVPHHASPVGYLAQPTAEAHQMHQDLLREIQSSHRLARLRGRLRRLFREQAVIKNSVRRQFGGG